MKKINKISKCVDIIMIILELLAKILLVPIQVLKAVFDIAKTILNN